MIKDISKENIALACELFGKCIEASRDKKVFSAKLDFTSYVGWFDFDIYTGANSYKEVEDQITSGGDEALSSWLNEMIETLKDEKSKSDNLYSPVNIEATKEKLKQERIARIKKTLAELES